MATRAASVDAGAEPFRTLLDPFLGSGPAAVAAIRAGRRRIGIAKERTCLQISRRRAAEEADRAAASAD